MDRCLKQEVADSKIEGHVDPYAAQGLTVASSMLGRIDPTFLIVIIVSRHLITSMCS
jgi:hypothetical protein